uniref:Sperm surface protein sp17-like protein isoform x2 n=1 Tax=Triatoma infestans TaxID=30076 RepID=A0A170UZ49_TRIIF
MEYIVQIRGDHRIYPIPEGLYELMADITREVLRSQPQNLYKFIYNYLDAQIKTRVLTIEAMKILNEIIIDGQPMTSYLAERGLTLDEANEAAKKIQQFW